MGWWGDGVSVQWVSGMVGSWDGGVEWGGDPSANGIPSSSLLHLHQSLSTSPALLHLLNLHLLQEEYAVIETARNLCAQMNLALRIDDAEWQFDKKRLTM